MKNFSQDMFTPEQSFKKCILFQKVNLDFAPEVNEWIRRTPSTYTLPRSLPPTEPMTTTPIRLLTHTHPALSRSQSYQPQIELDRRSEYVPAIKERNRDPDARAVRNPQSRLPRYNNQARLFSVFLSLVKPPPFED